MHTRTLVSWLVLPLAGMFACSADDNPVAPGPTEAGVEQASTPVDAGLCTWPNGFPTGEETALGCWAHPITDACLSPGEPTCQSACSASEYALHCIGEYTWPDSGCQTRIIPGPDSSLGCRLLPLPTTGTDEYYCCPCGPSQVSLGDASVMVSTLCHE